MVIIFINHLTITKRISVKTKIFKIFKISKKIEDHDIKIERMPTLQDLQVVEDENPPWINLESNSYVLAVSGMLLYKFI